MGAPLGTDIQSQILDATSKLLEERAFTDISLSDIAQAAGISKGTLYYYYKSKANILFDIADRYFNSMAERLIEWIENPEKDTSYKRLLRYVFRSGIYDESGKMRLFLISAALSGDDFVREKLLHTYDRFKAMLVEDIAERKPDGDAQHQVWMLLTMMDGLLIQSQLHNPTLDIDAFIEKMIDTMDEMS